MGPENLKEKLFGEKVWVLENLKENLGKGELSPGNLLEKNSWGKSLGPGKKYKKLLPKLMENKYSCKM